MDAITVPKGAALCDNALAKNNTREKCAVNMEVVNPKLQWTIVL